MIARAVLLCLLVVIGTVGALLAPPGARAADPTLSEVVDELGSTESSVRYAAYRELVRRDDPKTPALLAERLPEFDEACHYYGVLLLDRFPAASADKSLRKLLKCPSAYLRINAALLLHQRGTRGMAKVIVRELTDEDLPRATWLKAMVRLRGDRMPSDASVLRALLDPVVVGADAEVIRAIATVMNESGEDAAIPTFEALLADERAGTRALAAAFLRAQGQDRDADVAAAFLAGELASADVYALDRIMTKVGAAPVPPEIVDALIAASRADANTSSLRAIVQLLGEFASERSLPRLRELTSHKSKSVAKAAARAVEKLSGTNAGTTSTSSSLEPADTVALTKMTQDRNVVALNAWLTDESEKRRVAAADALRRMDDHAGLEVVLAACVSEDVVARREAVRAAGQFRVDAAVETLITASLDPDATVRSYALSALNTTLLTLFPQRGFRITNRGGEDTPASREKQAQQLRAWWTTERDAKW